MIKKFVMGVDYRLKENWLPPLKAIKMKCMDCCLNQRKEIELCPVKTCPLWPYRPFRQAGEGVSARKTTMTDSQKVAAATRLKHAREAKKAL